MFAVALIELAGGGSVEAEAPHLAKDLGVAVYESRLLLAGGTPTLLLMSPDKARALALLGAVRGRGHLVVACDTSAVIGSSDMKTLRRFRIDAEKIVADDGTELPFEEIMALLPALHRSHIDAQTETRGRKFNAALALATSGLVLTKGVVSTKRSTTYETERVLYIFRRDGQPPFLLREEGTHYDGLGANVAPSQHENFQRTLQLLREGAPFATFDDRLLSVRGAKETTDVKGALGTRTVTASQASGVDLLAHLLALSIARAQKSTAG